jgi:hypothetical protein
MQPRAWYFIPPDGKRHGPAFTEWQARVAAGRFAARRPKLESETAFILFRSLAKAGWRVDHTGTKDIPAPNWMGQIK